MKKIVYEFHAGKSARVKYQIEDSLFSLTGDVIISNFQQARVLAHKINESRKKEKKFDQYTTAGQINELGLLHEIYHYVIRYYENKQNPGVFDRAITYLKKKFGAEELDKTLLGFVNYFPPLSVYKKTITAQDYLLDATDIKSNKEITLEELILLHLENFNPAFVSLKELYDDSYLSETTIYEKLIVEIDKFFSKEMPFSPENLSLLNSLKKPILENPHDAQLQLNYIKNNWNSILTEGILSKILSSFDLIQEEARYFAAQGGGGKATPPVPVYKMLRKTADGNDAATSDRRRPEGTSKSYYYEAEHFTEDVDWMPNVVMIAKNTYVWLDQLSKKYMRSIVRLDQVPDEELDMLSNWNFTALWLIGIWERSSASQKIKQYMGNSEAVSSAYSIYDYIIAKDLGGEEAYENLKARAWQRGIRIACDVVPNHTGIYSKWVVDHPEYFIQSEYPPFPNYSFTGIDLSEDPGIQLRIEDRYYNKTDAAVVFQRIDNHTGKVIYIYHGNDGTNMPWNDTSQLNLLKQEVREALIQTIMKVAKKSPIIRFDAAMTLAKKHFQRLWFPLPGTGGAIPSRSDFSINQETFDSMFPVEFWREVVDRINSEMPNTLLLAEAFWLMEGYFVRTLGMHRVYNSAFMHMFMKEENDKFRMLIKNTLEYNPEILKRYVNFMSNPDEETAINQFGKGDKYFGVAVMMVTIPGLPMFGHGQIEGYTEKYGMEYRKAYYNESIDDFLVNRHKREIFPLIKKRDLFSQVANFEFYDFIDWEGNINESVMCFSNFTNKEKALVFFNNSYPTVSGSINYSCNKIIPGSSQTPAFSNKKLSNALNLKTSEGYYYTFRDHKTNLEYIRSGRQIDESGFNISLYGYQYFVFIDFQEHLDFNGELHNLNQYLNGAGVPSINKTLAELKLLPLHNAVKGLLNYCSLDEFEKVFDKYDETKNTIISDYLQSEILNVLGELKKISSQQISDEETLLKVEESLLSLFSLLKRNIQNGQPEADFIIAIKNFFIAEKENNCLKFVFSYCLAETLFGLSEIESVENKRKRFEEFFLEEPILQSFDSFTRSYDNSKHELDLFKILLFSDNIFDVNSTPTGIASPVIDESSPIIDKLFVILNEKSARLYLNINTYKDIEYFSKENFEKLITWSFIFAVLKVIIDLKKQELEISDEILQKLSDRYDILNALILKAETSEYKIKVFMESLT